MSQWSKRIALFGASIGLGGLIFGCASPSDKTGQTKFKPSGSAAATGATPSAAVDPYLALENSDDPATKSWVVTQNLKTESVLEGDPRAKDLSTAIRKIATAEDRIPAPTLANGFVRNFWQDANHKRGIWRTTTVGSFAQANPVWATLLDIDELNAREKKSWVFEKATCLPPKNDRCLIELSDGGRDEAEVREFKVSTKSFVTDGFNVPAAKTDVAWSDQNSIIIGSDFGPGTLTSSGYPRQVKLWRRGEDLAKAKLLFEGRNEDVSVTGYRTLRPDSDNTYVNEAISFFTNKNYLVDKLGKLQLLPFPDSSSFEGEFKGFLFASLKKDWAINGRTYVAGTVLTLPVSKASLPNGLAALEVVFEPSAKSAYQGLEFTRDNVLISTLNNVHGELWSVSHAGGAWQKAQVKLPQGGTLTLLPTDPYDVQNRVYVTYETFNVPPALYFGGARDFSLGLKVVKQLSAKYDTSGVVVEQFESTSKDGTQVPYFVIHKKDYKLDGLNPTLLYAYGGFEVPETPFYLGSTGKVWIEKGGVYVLANIRGGGEFGPAWHSAGVKENRQRVYEDFASVAEDLFNRKVTSPRRLGIEGGSNGGLLVGVAMTEHPDYFHAVVCESALLDMLRYTKLPPGASWIGEYGDPDDAKMAAYIETYSPYQNVKPGIAYPKAFFHISTADDRVQPGHTRKMVARLEQYGNDVLMFENTEGGHGGAADIEQRVRKATMEFTYLYQQLMD